MAPGWDDDWPAAVAAEGERLAAALGEADGRSILDCSCGMGTQALALAARSWRVTAGDLTAPWLAVAQARARALRVDIDFRQLDMRELAGRFPVPFDAALTCMALDNLPDLDAVRAALAGLAGAIRPGGRLYLRLRDLEEIARDLPRYQFKEERALPHGRLLRLKDWEDAGDGSLICAHVFLREDRRWPGSDAEQEYTWHTEVFRYRRRVLPKAELGRLLAAAGFGEVRFLSTEFRHWRPLELLAIRGRQGSERSLAAAPSGIPEGRPA